MKQTHFDPVIPFQRLFQAAVAMIVATSLTRASVAAPTARATPSRPNIIFLFTDDQRWDTLGCMGNGIVQTPHIDRLAREGTLFRSAFVTTSICSVSRASVFSGQYERRHGIDDFAKEFSPEAWGRTYPALLRKHGYRTGFIGKFGVGKTMPVEEFDYWRGFPGQGSFFTPGDPQHLTAKMGDQALEFLEGPMEGRPFCLSISFKAPHAQDRAPREFPPDPRDVAFYENVTVPVAQTASGAVHDAQPEFVRNSEGRVRWERRFATPEMHQNTVKDYYRLITGVDREVGRIREALRQLGLEENTVIVFTSDNGFFLGERGLAGKWLMYEESIRVPMIICDPRLPRRLRGQERDEMVLNIDVAPTLLEYAGTPVPEAMQGRSLRPLVENRRVRDWRSDWYYEHHYGIKTPIPQTEGVRTATHKYVRYVSADPVVEELYDLRKDPAEVRDMAVDPRHAKLLARMRARWAEYRDQLQ